MKNALIVIDMQNYFVREFTKNLPKKIAKLIGQNKYDYVLFTQLINNPKTNYVKLLNWRKVMNSPEIDIHQDLARFVNDRNLFTKQTYSIFKNKKFVKFLTKNKITDLYLCGIAIDACVLATAFDAFDLGYKVKILKGYTSSHGGRKFVSAATSIIDRNIQKE